MKLSISLALGVVGLVGSLLITYDLAHAGQQCGPLEPVRKEAIRLHGTWRKLNYAEYHFLQGVFAMNPNTEPPGLPIGDTAVLTTAPGTPGGLIIFIDDDKACGAMPVPVELIEILGRVTDVKHDGET